MKNPGTHLEDLLDDLILIRKGTGFTPAKMNNAGYLIQVLGGSTNSFETLKSRFISALTSLHESESRLLLAVFALLPETEEIPTLKARREWYGRQINRKIDTVMNREKTALKNLRNQLITG